jgi:uncharacterized hydrophobic protein (TIGR00271 family)
MTARERIESLLAVGTDDKPRVYLAVLRSAEVLSLNYALELLLAAGIATLGLVLNSPAVVIGAMLISPLMGPILAAGLAFAAADLYLAIKSAVGIALSVVASVAFSATLVWLLPFQAPTGEILARTQPNLLDLGVALFSGLAGSLVVCRGGGGGGVTALPGVAIAVALMPPLCTVGFGVGAGWNWAIISGAGLLFLTNLAAIVASAFLAFYVVRMDAPDVRMKIGYAEMEAASPDRLYKLLTGTWIGRTFGDLGRLRWRVLMLLASLIVLFVPLRQSLYHLRDETIGRAAVREAMNLLGPPDAFLTRQIDLQPDRIVVRLVAAAPVAAETIRAAERIIIQRSGKQAAIHVRKVASEEEIAMLRDRLRQPQAPLPPTPQTLESLRAEIVGRLEPVVRQVWPADAAELAGQEIAFTPDGSLVRLRYRARAPLDAAAEEMILRVLRDRLEDDRIRLLLEYEKPAPRPRTRADR